MKKIALLFTVISVICSSCYVFADDFDSLNNLTPEQKDKLTALQNDYNQENAALDKKIIEYSDKLQLVKEDKDKTPAQISLLSGAYERNIESLKMQKEILNKQTETSYKALLTNEQYEQFKAVNAKNDETDNASTAEKEINKDE